MVSDAFSLGGRHTKFSSTVAAITTRSNSAMQAWALAGVTKQLMTTSRISTHCLERRTVPSLPTSFRNVSGDACSCHAGHSIIRAAPLLAVRRLVSLALAVFISLSLPAQVQATDLTRGGQLFTINCAACHAGWGNILKSQRTLSQRDLSTHLPNYLKGHESAIVAQVTYGRNAMPAFLDVLSEREIDDVAAYVEAQPSSGWN